MFYGNSVSDIRLVFFNAWSNHKLKKNLTPLEQQLIAVILDHPEYHAMLDRIPQNPDQAFFPELGETNPFLHLGLHLSLREQVATDRPIGISTIYKQLVHQTADPHQAEHALMECLAACLWHAQQHQTMPNEINYLDSCRQLINLTTPNK